MSIRGSFRDKVKVMRETNSLDAAHIRVSSFRQVGSKAVNCRIAVLSSDERAVQGREAVFSTHSVLFRPGQDVKPHDELHAVSDRYKVNTVTPRRTVSANVTHLRAEVSLIT